MTAAGQESRIYLRELNDQIADLVNDGCGSARDALTLIVSKTLLITSD